METADAAYLALQRALSWINDLVSDSIFHAKPDLTLICPLRHQKKRAEQRFSAWTGVRGKYTNNLALGGYAVGVSCVQSGFSEINIGSD